MGGCAKPVQGCGLCGMHLKRLRKTGGVGQPEPMHAVSWAGASCLVDRCGSAVKSRGMCTAHYKRWTRWGDPTIKRPTTPASERFWSRVNKDGPVPDFSPPLGQCWIWTAGRTAQGYGGFHPAKGQMTTAHRWAYIELHGDIRPDLVVDHLCRVRLCVNPRHLEAVTGRENLRRGAGYALLNGMRAACRNGHAYTPENTYIDPTKSTRRCRVCSRARSIARTKSKREAAL